MNDKKIVIHIGLPKTGSTFLQNEFFSKLQGVTYIGRPYTQENFAFNTLQYADDSLYSSYVLAKELEQIIKISKNETILISDELFSGYPLYNFLNRGIIAKRLSELLPNAEIIMFVRNQIDLISSLYNQYVKIGWISNPLSDNFFHDPGKGMSLEDWFSGNKTWNKKNRFISHRTSFSAEHFKYNKLYQLYSNLFNNINIFLYEDFCYNPIIYTEKLASILRVKTLTSIEPHGESTNKSLNEKNLKNKLLSNRIQHILPNINENNLNFISKISRPFLLKNLTTQNREYISFILKKNKVDKDNIELNERINIGMENFTEKYFDFIV